LFSALRQVGCALREVLWQKVGEYRWLDFVAAGSIAYGAVPAPQMLTRTRDGLRSEVPAAPLWGAYLTVIPATLAMLLRMPGVTRPDLILICRSTGFRVCLRGQLVTACLPVVFRQAKPLMARPRRCGVVVASAATSRTLGRAGPDRRHQPNRHRTFAPLQHGREPF